MAQEVLYRIKEEISETPAWDPNGKYTRITLDPGQVCKKTGRSEEGLCPGTIVSCEIGNAIYTGIRLCDDWANEGLIELIDQVGGSRRRKATKAKKSKKAKRSKRRHTRKH